MLPANKMNQKSEIEDFDFYFNGLNGDTGDYLVTPANQAELFTAFEASVKKEVSEEAEEVSRELAARWDGSHNDLAIAGWGIIYAAEDEAHWPKIEKALEPLIDHRLGQTENYKTYKVGKDQPAFVFMKDNGVRQPAAAVNPMEMPYYLLIVGGPKEISFTFQYQLDVRRAVGRIHFDSLQEYANYAHSVVAAETGSPRPQKGTFFSVANNGDRATELSDQQLVRPLMAELQDDIDNARISNWELDLIPPSEALKPVLKKILGGSDTPSLLFTASHGLHLNIDNPRHLKDMGALVCQEWGQDEYKPVPIPTKYYFSADDIADDANLNGLISFHFACFGAGTPMRNQFPFSRRNTKIKHPLALDPFVAALPKRMLSQSDGCGSLAFVGHVERAWNYSFYRIKDEIGHPGTFHDSLLKLMQGDRLGHALKYFNEQYAALSENLTTLMFSEIEKNKAVELRQKEFGKLWTERNDVRSYTIIGDPAVCLSKCSEEATDIEVPTTPIVVSTFDGPAHGNRVINDPVRIQMAIKQSMSNEEHDELDFMPQPQPQPGGTLNESVLAAWQQHTVDGYKNNQKMFEETLAMYKYPYRLTLLFYSIWFLTGISAFILAIVFAFQDGSPWQEGIFGSISIITFIAFFWAKPLHSMEENLILITRLGLIFTSYWARTMNTRDAETFDTDMTKITHETVEELDKLLKLYRESSRFTFFSKREEAED